MAIPRFSRQYDLGGRQDRQRRTSHPRRLFSVAPIDQRLAGIQPVHRWLHRCLHAGHSPQFTEGLQWQWQNLCDCASASIDRGDPDYSPYMPLETTEGKKRVCWNSWISLHNFEGFFLNMGDMLVKVVIGKPRGRFMQTRNSLAITTTGSSAPVPTSAGSKRNRMLPSQRPRQHIEGENDDQLEVCLHGLSSEVMPNINLTPVRIHVGILRADRGPFGRKLRSCWAPNVIPGMSNASG